MPVLEAGSSRILYIHVPKTGGSYVEDLLRSYGRVSGLRFADSFDGLPCSPQHFHRPLLEHLYSVDRWQVAHAFDYVFMTVRHPVHRLESEFRYRYPSRFRDRVRRKLGVATSFGEWATWALGKYGRDPFLFDNHIRPQVEFRAFDAQIFRLEDGLVRIADVLDRVTGRQGRVPPDPVNRSQRPEHLSFDINARAKKRIVDFYAEDFAEFGYELAAR